jgi:uncharacterized membrane protein
MNVQLPTKLDELSENVYLRLTITADGKESYLEEYTVAVQRNSYELGLISLDYEESVSAGQTVPVSVVIRNTGFENSQDSFVVVSIPELGVSAKAYVGDLVAIESCDTDCDSEDTIQKIVNLKIPANAKEGTYSMVVRVYDDDSSKTFERTIRVGTSVDSQVIAATKSQDMRAGETKTFEMIIVNSADKVGVYNIQSTASSGMTISVPSVVTVDAGSSKLVQVSVKLSNDLAEGVYPFTVDVNGQSVVFSANVEGKSFSISGTVVLTIILLVIFVALLVVLIALLFRKDNKASSEEVETSYY